MAPDAFDAFDAVPVNAPTNDVAVTTPAFPNLIFDPISNDVGVI